MASSPNPSPAGVAKEAEVVAVRILDCSGSGTISDTVAALDWVAANHIDPAIVTLSLGIQVGSWSRVLEDAVRSLVLDHNITVRVGAVRGARGQMPCALLVALLG